MALALAFALDAELMLLDEPLADLDQKSIEIVCQAVADASDSVNLIASSVRLSVTLPAQSYYFPFPMS